MNIRILRQTSIDSKPYWQEFCFDRSSELTIAGMLDAINARDDLRDVDGNKASYINWECSCLQGACGACAMVVNKKPVLACETFIRDIRSDTIVIEPLKKFPTITDLIVDRSIISDNLIKVKAYIKEYKGANEKDYNHMYLAAKCLKCGLCLEICPNYKAGSNFFGASFANDSFLIASRSKTNEEDIRKSYKEHFERGCSKALSCMKICPVKIPTIASIGKMN